MFTPSEIAQALDYADQLARADRLKIPGQRSHNQQALMALASEVKVLRAENVRLLMESAARADERVAIRLEVDRLREENARLREALENMIVYAQEWHDEYAEKWGVYRKELQDRVQQDINEARAALSSQAPEAKGESREALHVDPVNDYVTRPEDAKVYGATPIKEQAKGESGEASEYPVPYEIISGSCCVPCPFGVPGKVLPVIMLGSASCRECEYSGDRKATGSRPVKCFYNARHSKPAEEQKT